MDTKLRCFLVLSMVSILIVSCGGGAPATEAPAATEPPAGTEVPATEAPAATQPPATEPPASTEPPTEPPASEPIAVCSVTPDGLGQQAGGHVSATTILDEPHGIYVYKNVIDQIEQSDAFMVPTAAPQEMTDLVVILVADTFSESFVSDNQIAAIPEIESFIRGVDLYLEIGNEAKGLLVVAVDTNDLNYDDISSNIPAAIEFFSTYSDIVFASDQGFDFPLPKATGIVINMSFVFIPCEPMIFIETVLQQINTTNELNLSDDALQDLNVLGEEYNIQDGNFYKYVNCIEPYQETCRPALRSLRSRFQEIYPENLVDAAVFNAFIVDLVYDPEANQNWLNSFPTAPCSILAATPPSLTLQDCLKKFELPHIIYVGAAGNFKYPRPFAPASWDTVISVSSQGSTQESQPQILDSATGLALAEYSNWGEVQMDGVFLDDSNFSDNILGTSFAAPKFSVKVARHLLQGSNCPMGLNSSSESGPWKNEVYGCSP